MRTFVNFYGTVLVIYVHCCYMYADDMRFLVMCVSSYSVTKL